MKSARPSGAKERAAAVEGAAVVGKNYLEYQQPERRQCRIRLMKYKIMLSTTLRMIDVVSGKNTTVVFPR